MKPDWPIFRVWFLHFVLLAAPLGVLCAATLMFAPGLGSWTDQLQGPLVFAAIALVTSAALTVLQFGAGQRWGRRNKRTAAGALRGWRVALWCAVPAWALILLLVAMGAINRMGMGWWAWESDAAGVLVGGLFLAYLISPVYVVPLLANATLTPDDAMGLGDAAAHWPDTCPECGTTLCEQRIALPKPRGQFERVAPLLASATACLALLVTSWLCSTTTVLPGGGSVQAGVGNAITYGEIAEAASSNRVCKALMSLPPGGEALISSSTKIQAYFSYPSPMEDRLFEFGWPIGLMRCVTTTNFTDASHSSTAPIQRSPSRLTWHDGYIYLTLGTDDLTPRRIDIHVNTGGIALFVIFTLVAWIIVRSIQNALLRANATRRRLRGLCVVCAYPLRSGVMPVAGRSEP